MVVIIQFFLSIFCRVYLWHDDKGKKITKTNVSAPQYIDFVMTCCHKYLHDDAVFPTKYGESWNCYNVHVQKISMLHPQKGMNFLGVEGSVRPKSFIGISRGVEVWIFSGTTQLFSWIINFFMCVPAKLAVVIWKFVSEYSVLLHFPISMFTSHAALFMFSFFGFYLCTLYVFSFVYTMYLHVLLTLFSVSHKPNCLAQVQFSRYWNIIYCTDISLDIVFLIG